ncbi:DUF3888 domain-containing protein [Anaerobacillus isosaccharinicus]|uniref:DUF3888 domain-containing protein n=1 Tax=Anaerobacillus isosaccharinicus TaxID=1532552 RepID=A0A1S2LEB1_9BACI|nr:DUF3888 domain-containing protein [Anaerobacillus isosaccharinicus]MBA5587125.1 DUF3888 domain-containing protein [Anaerobacillus isosaccharinicus]QOY34679.1 DUF3888 domain-containing protein [Anaerobacillus isosaccharinicus]
MKKFSVMFMIGLLFVFPNLTVNAKTINESDTELCETLKYALIGSLREPVDKAIVEIYKDDKNAPEGLTWATYDTEILKIKQVYGVGGLYELTLKIYPYYQAHMSYGEDEVVINTMGELISFTHLKTYP